MNGQRQPIGVVLSWEQHDSRHQPHPLTGRKLYILDRAPGHPELRYCRFCGAYVHPRHLSADDE